MRWPITLATIVTASISGCDRQPPKTHYTLLEAISLGGTCKEDHANQAGQYTGTVVRWRNDSTGKIAIYGSVTIQDWTKHTIETVTHPTAYYPPFMVSFDDIHVDTRQARWTLHGVSDSRSNHEADDDGSSDTDADSDTDNDAKTAGEIDTENGYATTCELDVTGRGKKLPDLLNSDTLKNKLGH